MLKFSTHNRKLDKLAKRIGKKVCSFSTLSGHDCPYAKDCQSMVVDGKIVDGKHTKFRCFSASEEAVYPAVYRMRKYNSDLIRAHITNKDNLIQLIHTSIPNGYDVIRIHVAGDYMNQVYFDAWLEVAKLNPDKIFYSYTKSLPFWIKRMDCIPANFRLTASRGGRKDNLINEYNLREAVVIHNKDEADALGLEIDSDDFHAYDNSNQSFALVVHGVQPKGTTYAKAVYANRTAK